jgi:hypothetical protein
MPTGPHIRQDLGTFQEPPATTPNDLDNAHGNIGLVEAASGHVLGLVRFNQAAELLIAYMVERRRAAPTQYIHVAHIVHQIRRGSDVRTDTVRGAVLCAVLVEGGKVRRHGCDSHGIRIPTRPWFVYRRGCCVGPSWRLSCCKWVPGLSGLWQ